MTQVDGNILDGPLGAVFAVEMSTAIAVCAGCGGTERMAATQVYGAPMGLIVRCPGCGEVLLRYAETPSARTLDMRGIRSLRLGPQLGA